MGFWSSRSRPISSTTMIAGGEISRGREEQEIISLLVPFAIFFALGCSFPPSKQGDKQAGERTKMDKAVVGGGRERSAGSTSNPKRGRSYGTSSLKPLRDWLSQQLAEASTGSRELEKPKGTTKDRAVHLTTNLIRKVKVSVEIGRQSRQEARGSLFFGSCRTTRHNQLLHKLPGEGGGESTGQIKSHTLAIGKPTMEAE
ncbi:hypothetical protein ACRALDRAFT_209586 [Sodiomyces alcalophilus JCM 7366]|uniref:uncharacterized protein n=1 Tax=Sodiomyces alcalophilus JCM 7366 TaxID=591952 RepID=UPI0039B6814E